MSAHIIHIYGLLHFNLEYFLEIQTEITEVQLDLPMCKKYIVGVSAADSTGVSQPPQNWLRIRTKYDTAKPPANPQMIVKGKEIRFSWEHSCKYRDEHPKHYLFRVNDLSLNQTNTYEVEGLLWYRLERIYAGANYEFTVSSPDSDAVPFVWKFVAPPLPAPGNFNIIAVTDEKYTFSWDLVDFRDES